MDKQITDFQAMFDPEELEPELADYLTMPDNEDEGFAMIQHPLVYSVPYIPELNKMLNQQLKAKQEALDKAVREDHWTQYVFLYERPYRLQAFMQIEANLSDAAYWELLREVWTDSENIWQHHIVWMEAWSARPLMREAVMEDDELTVWEGLPDIVTIYRGFSKPERDKGMSWTLDRAKAEWFATRFASVIYPAQVLRGTVKKSDVLAYFDSRGESEIVCLPEKVNV